MLDKTDTSKEYAKYATWASSIILLVYLIYLVGAFVYIFFSKSTLGTTVGEKFTHSLDSLVLLTILASPLLLISSGIFSFFLTIIRVKKTKLKWELVLSNTIIAPFFLLGVLICVFVLYLLFTKLVGFSNPWAI